MGALLRLNHLHWLEPGAVKAADDAGITDRRVEAVEVRVVHDDVGHPGQRQMREQISRVPVEHEQSPAVGCAEQPTSVEAESVRPLARDPERSLDHWALAVD